MSKKNEVKEVEAPEKDVKPISKNKGDLKTLLELVENSTVSKFKIGINLSKKGYLKQYYEEERRHKAGFPIEPSMTELEFKRIIGD